MDVFGSLCSLVVRLPYLLLIPIYIILSPLCIISSSLFEAAVSLTIDIDQQTVILIMMLLIVWCISATSILHLIKTRTDKYIFFYEFVFFISCTNFILIGITYSILKRNNIVEQVLAKIFTTMFMILIAQKLKIKCDERQDLSCKICLSETNHNDCIFLRCKHCFHQKCLWDWLYVKKQCPLCFTKVTS